MTEVHFGYPLQIQARGPISYEKTETGVEVLDEVHLDFYYILSIDKFETVVLSFLPAGYPDRVRVNANGGLVDFERDTTEGKMRQIIKDKYGDKVTLFRLKTA